MTASDRRANVLDAAKGSGSLAGGSLAALAIRFAIALVLARNLGVLDYGLYVLGISVATLCSGIALLGLDDAMVRYVAILTRRSDDAGVKGTLEIGFTVTFATSVLMGALLFAFAEPVATRLFHEPELVSSLRMLGVVVPFLTLNSVLVGVLLGLRRMGDVALAQNVVRSSIRLAISAGAALLGALDLSMALIGFAVADIAASALMAVRIRRHLPHRGLAARRDTRAIMSFALPLWLSGMLRQFRRNIEVVLLGGLSSVSNVGVFSVVNRVNKLGHVGLLSLLVAVKPMMAQLHDAGERDALAHLYRTATRWAFALYLPFFLGVVLYAEQLLGVFGDGFTSGTTALFIIAAAELVNAATGVCGSLLDMSGHTTVKLVNSVAWTALLLGGSALLIPPFGVDGAAIATFIALCTVNVARVIEVRVLEGVLPFDRGFLKPVAAGIAAFAFGVVLTRAVPVGNFGIAVVQGGLVTAVYGGALVLLGLADDDRLVLERTLAKVRSRVRPSRRSSSAVAGGSR